jgi:hypothetical protein
MLPDAATAALWAALWRRLLAPVPDDDEPENAEQDEERAEEAA